MASGISQTYVENKTQFRGVEGDGEEEEDGEEMLDPRVKGELDRLNSSTAEINRLEQDLEELQATFRQTLTESAYILKSQATFLGVKCIDQARPYYNAVQKAKQSQIETQRAALKYERACSSHQAAKKMLSVAEQKLVSTSKEHKVLDPTWQEMLNQAVLKVMESDKERALSEREHLDTARAFSEAGRKVTELKSKLKSSINKSRPYFELKMKYDQILEAHKRQVEIIQESLQEAKQKYSIALKNLEGISEEIHEMRRSRESLDALLFEREEGVGAESPDGDLSRDAVNPEADLDLKNLNGRSMLQNKPSYGFKIALVSATDKGESGNSGVPVAERDGDPEGCNSLDELQVSSKHQELSATADGESEESVICRGKNIPTDTSGDIEESRDIAAEESSSSDSKSLTRQDEWTVVSVSSYVSSPGDPMEARDSSDKKEPEHSAEIRLVIPDCDSEISDDQKYSTEQKNHQFVVNKEDSNSVMDKDEQSSQIQEAATQESASMTDVLEQRNTNENASESGLDNSNRSADSCENKSTSVKQETGVSCTPSEQQSTVSEEDSGAVTGSGQTDSESDSVKPDVVTDNSRDGSNVFIEHENSAEFNFGEKESKSENLPNENLSDAK